MMLYQNVINTFTALAIWSAAMNIDKTVKANKVDDLLKE